MLSFDPSGLLSGNQCVEFLKEKNIIISQKLGARLLALKNHGIEVTLAALEDASPTSSYEKFLLSPELIQEAHCPQKLIELISSYIKDDPFKFINENNILKIMSFYEEPTILLPSTVQSNQTPVFIQPQSISPQSLLNDRKYIEEAAFAFLDSQDEFTVGENLRKLVRISVMSNQDPSNLLITAINKENQAIWIQTAEIIKELLDKQFGNKFKKFITVQSKTESEILFSEMLEETSLHAPFKIEVLMAILPQILKRNGDLNLILYNLEKLEIIINKKPELITGIVSGVIKTSQTSDPMDVKKFRLFLKKLPIDSDSASLIAEELEQESEIQAKVYLLWFLSAFEKLNSKLKQNICSAANSILLKNIKNPSWLEAIKTVFINFLPQSLEALEYISDAIQNVPESNDVLGLIIDIWEEAYKQNQTNSNAINKILSLIDYCLKNELQTEIKKILTLSLMENEIIISALESSKKSHEMLLDCSLWIFTNDKVEKFKTSIPKLIKSIKPDVCKMFQEKLNYKYENFEEILEDELEFLTELALLDKEDENRTNAISFLNTYGHTKKFGLTLFLRTKLMNSQELSQEIAELLLNESENVLDEEIKLKILFQLLPILPEDIAERKIECIFADIDNLPQSKTDIFMEFLTKFFAAGFYLKNTDKILKLFLKENAFKITMPPLSAKMKSDEDDSIMKQYDCKKWNWENVGQSLFCSLEVACNLNINEKIQKQAIDVIMYVFRHWANKNTVFMLKDEVIFRIIRELAERKGAAETALVEIADKINRNFKETDKIENSDLKKFICLKNSSFPCA